MAATAITCSFQYIVSNLIYKPSEAILLLPSGQTCIQMFIYVLLRHFHSTHWTLHCNTKIKSRNTILVTHLYYTSYKSVFWKQTEMD